jgi:hypothetical protein
MLAGCKRCTIELKKHEQCYKFNGFTLQIAVLKYMLWPHLVVRMDVVTSQEIRLHEVTQEE